MVPRQRQLRRWALGLALLLAFITSVVVSSPNMLPSGTFPDCLTPRSQNDSRIAVAVLGDSDSQGYQDRNWNPLPARGGAYRDITLQWTEVLDRLRSAEVDLGEVGWWGGRAKVVRILRWLGCQRRLPRKLDHQYNFAFGGAHSNELTTGDYRQAQQLLSLMDRDPQRWLHGVVVIRIGIVDLGGDAMLAAMGKDCNAPEVQQAIQSCLLSIVDAVTMIRSHHPETRFVVVGILDNTDCPPNSEKPLPPDIHRNITQALDQFDASLREVADSDPRIAFFDDRAWFRDRWGGRSRDGSPAYRSVEVGKILRVPHEAGDSPTSSVLRDSHAGLVWNTLWCQSMTRVLAGDLGLPVTPILDREVEQFLELQCSTRRR
jgi:hypothetical protein